MSKKSLILSIPILALVLLLGGWLLLRRSAPVSGPAAVPPAPTTPSVPALPPLEPPTVPPTETGSGGNGQVASRNRLQHIELIPGNSNEVWYAIPEMGVRMKLNKRYAEDLYYSLTEWKGEVSGNSLNFYLTNQVAKDVPNCSGGISLGGLFRHEGDLEELKRKRSELDPYLATRLDGYIQVGSYYYGRVDPHDVCWDVSMEEKIKEAFLEKYSGFGANSILEGMKTLELIP